MLFAFRRKDLYCSGNLPGTQTTGAGVNVGRSAIDDRLDTLDVGLPGPVRTPMGVRNLDSENNTLTAEIAFSHTLHLLNSQKLRPVITGA